MLHMREQMLRALLAHAQGDIAKHKANVEIYLEHPAGVGEHTDILESIEKELDIIAKYQDQIEKFYLMILYLPIMRQPILFQAQFLTKTLKKSL